MEESYRLSCLTLVLDHFSEIDEGETLKIAKKFSDFVLSGKIEDAPAANAAN